MSDPRLSEESTGPRNSVVERVHDKAADGASAEQEFVERRSSIRRDMGGQARIERLHREGRFTIREHIDAFVDPGSFREIGTFAASARLEDRDSTPGDGKLGGHAMLGGRPVTVCGDDETVKRASSSRVGGRKLDRMYEFALRSGNPFVYFGMTGGARIPDLLGSEGFTALPPTDLLADREHRIPLVTGIVGDSYGGSSVRSAVSDLVVQIRGTCLAVASPRVMRGATGEECTPEELGGSVVGDSVTGQVDVAVDAPHQMYDVIRRFLDVMPSSSGQAPRVLDAPESSGKRPGVVSFVPARRTRAYDMRKVLTELLDPSSYCRIGDRFGPSVLCGLGRLGGYPVGVIASQPMVQAGAITPDACTKMMRHIVLCDSFNLPIVFLQDTPGFLVGPTAEHARLLTAIGRLFVAWRQVTTPVISLVIRKAFGLAYYAMGGTAMGSALHLAWPRAELSFMDPGVAASVLTTGEHNPRGDFNHLAYETSPYGAARQARIDEIIAPSETADWLTWAVRTLWSPSGLNSDGRLRNWPAR